MRISDWSSDVCSSDLQFADYARSRSERSADWDATFRLWLSRAIQWKSVVPAGVVFDPSSSMVVRRTNRNAEARAQSMGGLHRAQNAFSGYRAGEIGRASCRDRVGQDE